MLMKTRSVAIGIYLMIFLRFLARPCMPFFFPAVVSIFKFSDLFSLSTFLSMRIFFHGCDRRFQFDFLFGDALQISYVIPSYASSRYLANYLP
jgi:hypothetical protein